MEPTRPTDSPASSGESERASELKEEAKATASQFAEETRESLQHTVAETRESARGAAEGMLDSLADQLEAFADELRGQDIDSLIERARDTAHRNPELFFAGSVAAGLAIARFAKSSARKRAGDDGGSGTRR